MTSFGIATIAAPRAPRDRSRKFDCGRYGKLSAKEIARIAGMSREGVWQRVQSGIVGAELCAPKHERLRGVKEKCARPTVMVAMKLARAYPDKTPTLAQIQKVHPMTARNAMRWRQALVETSARL